MKFKNLEKRIRNTALTLAFTGASYFLSPSNSYADTVYYGKLDKSTTQTVGYVVWDEIKVKSKYEEELKKLGKTDPKYNVILEKRNNSVREAIKKTGEEEKYDAIVESDDPKIENYKNINSDVTAKLKEIEK